MFKLSRWLMFSSALLAPCFSNAFYDLDDFEGDYISRAYSVGGNNVYTEGSNTNPTSIIVVGDALSSVAQFHIDKRGHGTVNFLSYTQYALAGSFASPTPIRTVNGTPTFQFQLLITDPQNGAGTITFTDYPVPGETQLFYFVSIKDDGKVREMFLNLNNVTPLADIVATVQAIVKRQ